MFSLVSLLIAAALVSMQSAYVVSAQVDTAKNDLDNNLQVNPLPPQRRRLRSYVRLTQAPPQRVSFEPGSSLELTCTVAGSPAPQVQWLKNGEPMQDYEEETNEIPMVTNNVARLISKLVLRAARDGDVFTCDATNGLKEVSASTTVYTEEISPKLLTLEKLFPVPSKPVITKYYDEILQESGTSLLLPCRVSSYGEHQIFWQDNNSEVVYGSPRLQVLPSGDLLIVDLQWADMGQWTCTARNQLGKDSAATFVYPSKPRKQ